jgi:hypothetical protein
MEEKRNKVSRLMGWLQYEDAWALCLTVGGACQKQVNEEVIFKNPGTNLRKQQEQVRVAGPQLSVSRPAALSKLDVCRHPTWAYRRFVTVRAAKRRYVFPAAP